MSRRRNPYARPDARTRAAKAQGYPARSVYKLEEIDQRARLLRRGQRLLDLGAAPGSWTLYALERVGPEGRVLAVDLSPLTAPPAPNLRVLEADVLAASLEDLGVFAPYDLVLSDMAPNTSGSKVRDQALSFELFMRALEIAAALSRPGASFVSKLFMGPDFESARRALAENFSNVRVMRPETTRKQSSELFLVGLGKR